MKMYAHLTKDGTAMSETALCEFHNADKEARADVAAWALNAEDWSGNVTTDDCTENDALVCQECGCKTIIDVNYAVIPGEFGPVHATILSFTDGTTHTVRAHPSFGDD